MLLELKDEIITDLYHYSEEDEVSNPVDSISDSPRQGNKESYDNPEGCAEKILGEAPHLRKVNLMLHLVTPC